MRGSWRLRPSDWGISTKGWRNEGMLPRIAGIAWIERMPLAYMRVKQKPVRMSESRKGVKPLTGRFS